MGSARAHAAPVPRRGAVESSKPQKAVLKLQNLGISRIEQLPRATRLWFVRVFLGRQGPPRPAKWRTSGEQMFPVPPPHHTHTHKRARAPSLEVTRTAATEPHRYTRRGAHSAPQAPGTYAQGAPAENRRRCAIRVGHPRGTTRTSRASYALRVARGKSFARRHMRGATDAQRGREFA